MFIWLFVDTKIKSYLAYKVRFNQKHQEWTVYDSDDIILDLPTATMYKSGVGSPWSSKSPEPHFAIR